MARCREACATYREVEGGGIGRRGRRAALSGAPGQTDGFGTRGGATSTGKGGLALVAGGEVGRVFGGHGGATSLAGGQLFSFAGEIGSGRPFGEVVRTVPGEDGAQQADRACWAVGDAPAYTEPVSDQLVEVTRGPAGRRRRCQHRRPTGRSEAVSPWWGMRICTPSHRQPPSPGI